MFVGVFNVVNWLKTAAQIFPWEKFIYPWFSDNLDFFPIETFCNDSSHPRALSQVLRHFEHITENCLFTPEHAKTFPMNNDSSQWRGCEGLLWKSNLKPANAAVPNMEPYLQMPGRVCHLNGSVYVQSYPHASDLAASGCSCVSVK